MRCAKAVWLLAVAGPAMAVDSATFQLRDAADLVRLCSVAADDPAYANAAGFCHGFLTGAFQYYDATESAATRFVCAPSPPSTRSKVMDDFVVWANAHPQYMKERAPDALFRYLAATYPCKK
ncbi:MAG: Rap1a/Tai family immunity protein [Burkholderiales bacterium]